MHGLRVAVKLSVIALGVSALGGVAAAQSYEAPVRPFVLPDLSGLTMVGLDFQFTHWTTRPPPGLELSQTNLTFDLKAEISLAPHLVVLATLPVVHHSSELAPTEVDECCALAIGNLTAGARLLTSSRFGDTRTVIGGTVTVSLPTANDAGERGQSTGLSALAHAPHDPGLYGPNATTIRIGGAAQFYGRRWLVEPELGMHLFVFDDDVVNDDSDAAIRLGVAAGLRATEELAILAELNNMIYLGDSVKSPRDDLISSVDVGLRYATRGFLLGARAYLPLDSSLRDLDMLGFGLDVGGRF